MKILNAAVIGLGGMGRRHVSALDALAARGVAVRVSALCDMNAAVASELAAVRSAEGHDAPAVFADWREAIAAHTPGAGIDLLCIATNGPSHRDIVLAAAEAKIPFVLCEKPMSTSGAAAREMAAACEASGTRLAVNLCRRFFTRCLLLRQALRGGQSDGLVGRPRRFWSVIGGGGVGCVGLHYFDYAGWLFDAKPVWVSAELTQNPAPNVRGPQFFDPGGQVSVGFECADGWRFIGDFELSEDVPRASRCIIIGTEGVAETDDFSPAPAGAARATARPQDQRHVVKTRLVQPEPAALDHGPALDIVQATADCLADLLGAYEYPTIQAGIESVDVVMAAHLSAKRGGARVALPLGGADLKLDVPIT